MDEPVVVVLAAGLGTRFGGDKLEAMCAGKPLGRWAIEAVEAADLGPRLIVFSDEWPSYAEGWTHLINEAPHEGMGPSLAGAAHLALAGGAETLLVLLADMPLITAEYLCELAAQAAPAATRYPEGCAGVPALLDKALMEKAMRLKGDCGAAALLEGARLVDPPAGMLRDVDTPEDLAEVEAQLLAR